MVLDVGSSCAKLVDILCSQCPAESTAGSMANSHGSVYTAKPKVCTRVCVYEGLRILFPGTRDEDTSRQGLNSAQWIKPEVRIWATEKGIFCQMTGSYNSKQHGRVADESFAPGQDASARHAEITHSEILAICHS